MTSGLTLLEASIYISLSGRLWVHWLLNHTGTSLERKYVNDILQMAND